ncbi:MAG TPA: hypothetical protein VN258_00025, partial [Mobilitalea sp.]|nr:hypothetical protein [Mobilitalea sp.]
IAAKYPKLISGGKEKELNKWNRIISSDFDQILHIYSFNPVPEPTPVPSAVIPVILDIRYDIKDNNDKLISILYLAAFHNPYSAHPTDLVYTTNINKINSSRSRLGDTVKINEDFVKDFRTWDIVTKNENEEVNKAINDYIAGISDEDLLKGFQSADQIGSKNPWSIYSYYTPDKLGISIGVPNYIGDHVELEREYTKLKDFIKPETKILP